MHLIENKFEGPLWHRRHVMLFARVASMATTIALISLARHLTHAADGHGGQQAGYDVAKSH